MSLRSLVVALICASLSACGDPTGPQAEVVGRITQIFVVKDVFQNTNDYTLTVDSRVAGNGGCGETVSVHVNTTTKIAWSDAPDVQVGPEELALDKTVRVSPGKDPDSTECKQKIEATSIILLR